MLPDIIGSRGYFDSEEAELLSAAAAASFSA